MLRNFTESVHRLNVILTIIIVNVFMTKLNHVVK